MRSDQLITRSLRRTVDKSQRLGVTEFRLNPHMFTFGTFVANRRKQLGMTQAELARLSGLSPGTIGDIEQGNQFSTRNMDLLATALQLTPEQLRKRLLPHDEKLPEKRPPDPEEWALLEDFRAMSTAERERVKAYFAGVKGSRRGPRERRPTVAKDRLQTTKKRA